MIPFLMHRPADSSAPAPVVFDTPHSGVLLPLHFRYACARADLMHLHDPHVGSLLAHVPEASVPVLEALIHRTCIDLNRFEDEIDPATIDGPWPHPVRATFYAQRHLGLFPQMAGPRRNRIAPIYNKIARLTVAEAETRIRDYHRPYHAALAGLMAGATAAHGRALHIDVHSYRRDDREASADIILGDLNGKSCAPATRDLVADFFRAAGHSVDFNGPYFSGGALIQKTANPVLHHHSLQIEIARDLYMDQDSLAYDPVRGGKIARMMGDLAHCLKARF